MALDTYCQQWKCDRCNRIKNIPVPEHREKIIVVCIHCGYTDTLVIGNHKLKKIKS